MFKPTIVKERVESERAHPHHTTDSLVSPNGIRPVI